MVLRMMSLVERLPRAGAVRLYDWRDPPCLLPGEQMIADEPEHGPNWIVEPRPGRAAWAMRQYWQWFGRWVWAAYHLCRRCRCSACMAYTRPTARLVVARRRAG
jgi:hypothetical protein